MVLNRRQLFQVATVGGLGLVAAGSLGSRRVLAQADPYTDQVDAGLMYFQDQAQQQLPLVQALLEAIESGDVEAAQQAYVNARPPYEQIEVLALNFEQTDSDIDARPYSFDQGESSPEFIGFHRIEALIYRDEDLEAALPYAEGLVASVETLIEDLQQRQNFDSATHFEGMIGLATEIPSRKISSEEETWSDQSLLIFKENWNGIYSQYEPFAEVLASRDEAVAQEVTAAYEAAMELMEPYFEADQVAAQPYSTVSTSERGQITRVSYRLRDALVQAQEQLEIG